MKKQAQSVISCSKREIAISIPDVFEFLKTCDEKSYPIENLGSILTKAVDSLNDSTEKSILMDLSLLIQEMFIKI